MSYKNGVHITSIAKKISCVVKKELLGFGITQEERVPVIPLITVIIGLLYSNSSHSLE